jgi:hypothetical protein
MPNLLAEQIDIPVAFAPFIEREFHTGRAGQRGPRQ